MNEILSNFRNKFSNLEVGRIALALTLSGAVLTGCGDTDQAPTPSVTKTPTLESVAPTPTTELELICSPLDLSPDCN